MSENQSTSIFVLLYDKGDRPQKSFIKLNFFFIKQRLSGQLVLYIENTQNPKQMFANHKHTNIWSDPRTEFDCANVAVINIELLRLISSSSSPNLYNN